MADLAKYVVALEAETSKYRRELERANKKLGKFTKQQQKQLSKVEAGFKRLGLAAAAFVSTATLRRAAGLADSYNQLSTRIRTATRETGDFLQVQKDLADVAISTGSSFETTIDTFQALSRVRRDLGATNSDFVKLTRSVNQLGVIGGASTVAISNGLRQFNQGLAAGVFRAEEFNSIVENIPELANRIAAGLGKTQGELRQLVIDGKLLSKDVFKILLEQAEDISKQFEEIPNNLDRAVNALTTSLGQTLSTLDKFLGGTQAVADALSEIATRLSIASGNASLLTLAQQKLIDKQKELDSLRGPGRGQFGRNRGPKIAALEAEIKIIQQIINGERNRKDQVDQVRKAYEQLTKEASRLIPLQGPETPKIGALAGPQQGPEVPAARINPGLQATVMTTRETADELDQLIFGVFDTAEDRMQTFTTLFTDNMVMAADGGFDSILQSWVRTLQQMAARFLASKVFDLLGFGNGGGGFLGLGKLFGGERAAGGPVSSGRAYLVGEMGPELFVPGSAGNIVPNGGGGNVFNINARGATPGMEQKIAAAVETAVALSDRNRQDARRRGR